MSLCFDYVSMDVFFRLLMTSSHLSAQMPPEIASAIRSKMALTRDIRCVRSLSRIMGRTQRCIKCGTPTRSQAMRRSRCVRLCASCGLIHLMSRKDMMYELKLRHSQRSGPWKSLVLARRSPRALAHTYWRDEFEELLPGLVAYARQSTATSD